MEARTLPGFDTHVDDAGHSRPRIKDLPATYQPAIRLHQAGAGVLSTTEVIAAVLGAGDGLDLATELLARFDGLSGLIHASVTELQEIAGIGQARAAQLKAALELGRRAIKPDTDRPKVKSPEDAAALLLPEMRYLEQEELRVMLLNTKNRLIKTVTVYRGSLNASVVRVGELFRDAIRENAAAILVAHNHPSTEVAPSPQDVAVTCDIVDTGDMLDIHVLDHLVIGGNDWLSMREKGLGF